MTNVAVYGIAKNELHNVEEWIAQFKDADSITVIDTGSTDGTIDALRELAKDMTNLHVHAMSFSPFRFDSAKNVALSFVPANADLCLTVDFDERVGAGTVEKLRSLTLQSDQTGTIRLIFSVDAYGNPARTYPRESVHPRNGFYWKYPVHELLAQTSDRPHLKKDTGIEVTHQPDEAKDRSYYLELLQVMMAESPDVPRSYQYLGREFLMQGDYFQAIQYLKHHVQIETFGPFRAESSRSIAFAYTQMEGSLEGAADEAESWYYRAISEFTQDRESYYSLAHLYRSCGEFGAALGLIATASRMKLPTGDIIVNEALYNNEYGAHLKAVCEYESGDIEAAQSTIQELLSGRGDSVSLPQDLLTDIMTIFGVKDETNQEGKEDSKGGEEEVLRNGIGSTEDLPESVSEVLTSESSEG